MNYLIWGSVWFTAGYWIYHFNKQNERKWFHWFEGLAWILFWIMLLTQCQIFAELSWCPKCPRLTLSQVDGYERYYAAMINKVEFEERILADICEHHKFDHEDALMVALTAFIGTVPSKNPRLMVFTASVAFLGEYYRNKLDCHRVAKKHIRWLAEYIYEATRTGDILVANRTPCWNCEKAYREKYWATMQNYLILTTTDITWEMTHWDNGCWHVMHHEFIYAGDQ